MSNKMKVAKEMLSEQINVLNKHDLKVGTTKKLIPYLFPKRNCVIYYRNLKYYLSKKLKKCLKMKKKKRKVESRNC